MIAFLISMFSSGIVKSIINVAMDYFNKKADKQVGLAKEKTLRTIAELEARAAIATEQRKLQQEEPLVLRLPKLAVLWVVAIYLTSLGVHQLLSQPYEWNWVIHTIPMWDYVCYSVIAYWTVNGGLHTWNRMKR